MRPSEPVPPGRPVPPGARVEVATWRPVEAVDVDGWELGLSAGFTRRANSVVPRRAPADVPAALARVEQVYAARGARAVVRVDGSAQPADLDDLLAARGYAVVAPTRVLVRDVTAADTAAGSHGPTVTAADAPDDAWLAGWLDVKAAGRPVDPGVARAVVTGSAATYLTARDPHGVVGVIRAAYADDWVGLSCLMVAPRARRRGLARELSRRALAEASHRGASRAFLQVEAANESAGQLYAGLGFRLADEYHYRER